MDSELKILEILYNMCQKDNGPKRIRYMKFINLTYDLDTSENENIKILKKLAEKELVELRMSKDGDLKSVEINLKGLKYLISKLDVYKQIHNTILNVLLDSKTPITNIEIYEKTGIDICTINTLLYQYKDYISFDETMNQYQIHNIQIKKPEELKNQIQT